MEIRAIRTEAHYLAALREVSALIDLDLGTDKPEGERLEVLGTLVQAYGAKHPSIDCAALPAEQMLADRNHQSALDDALLKFDYAKLGGEFPVAGRD